MGIGKFQPKEMLSSELWRHVRELGIRKRFRSKHGGLPLRARPEFDVDFNNDNGANTVDGEPVIQFQSQSTVVDLVSKDERRRANARNVGLRIFYGG